MRISIAISIGLPVFSYHFQNTIESKNLVRQATFENRHVLRTKSPYLEVFCGKSTDETFRDHIVIFLEIYHAMIHGTLK